MNPTRAAIRCIADLDTALARTGETVTLSRLHDAPDGGQVEFLCENVPAKVTVAQPQEVVGTFAPSHVVISPTQLIRRQWPCPPRRDDRITIAGQLGVVESVVEERVVGVVVRYTMECKS